MNKEQIQQFVEKHWQETITDRLVEYIKIPNKSPAYDADWEKHGYMEDAVKLMTDWCEQHPARDMQMEVVRIEGRTPLIYIEIPGQIDETVVLYGHLDKQPEMTGWAEGLGPWIPVIKDDKLYGRGGADDGYAIFSSLTAINALQAQNIPHARCVILIEACEESGSYDLPFYIDKLKDKLGSPSLVVCLDSGAGNYEQMWVTTSLRGLVHGELTVKVLNEGIHSGVGSGVVPPAMLVLRQLLNRIEDINTGRCLVDAMQVEIPAQRLQQAHAASPELCKTLPIQYPLANGVNLLEQDPVELVLNRTWRSALSVTGLAGLPDPSNAGNVTIPELTVTLSVRVPPTCEVEQATAALKASLEKDAPFGAEVTFEASQGFAGWNAPEVASWLHEASDQASQNYFGKPLLYLGEGGSIPFMGMLGEKFPSAQFLITGVLGPQSNAHGPNEFLHLPTAKRLTCCVAEVVAKHYEEFNKA